jgi:hypothetical protein
MQYQETKDGPKIKCKDEAFFGLQKSSLLEGSFCCIQGKLHTTA